MPTHPLSPLYFFLPNHLLFQGFQPIEGPEPHSLFLFSWLATDHWLLDYINFILTFLKDALYFISFFRNAIIIALKPRILYLLFIL